MKLKYRSRPAWGAWIEIFALLALMIFCMSRPAWGAWIEILRGCLFDF